MEAMYLIGYVAFFIATKWTRNTYHKMKKVRKKLWLKAKRPCWQSRPRRRGRKKSRLPTGRMGAKASALEKKGIKTEIGDYNRAVLKHNAVILEAKAEIEKQDTLIQWNEKEIARLKATVVKEVLPDVVAEPKPNIQDFLMGLSEKGYLMILPIGKSESLDKITWRDKLQEPEYCLMVLKTEGILTWENFSDYMKGIDKRLNETNRLYKSNYKKVQNLKAYVEAYNQYAYDFSKTH